MDWVVCPLFGESSLQLHSVFFSLLGISGAHVINFFFFSKTVIFVYSKILEKLGGLCCFQLLKSFAALN